MKTELVISASSDQADIALLEDGRLQELIKEKGDDSFSVGDVYLGTSLKFLFFFLFIYPVFNADGDLSSMEFATFFIPYSLTTAVETVVLVQQLNRS